MYPIFAASDTGPLCSAYTDSLPSTEKATAFIDIIPSSTPAIAPTGNLHPDSIDEDSALSASALLAHQHSLFWLASILSPCPQRELKALAERALSSSIESGCRFPVGAIAGVDEGIISINAVAFSVDGKESVYAEQSGPVSEAAKIGYMAGKELKDGGIEKLALNWREKLAEWNKNG